nr:hypothetical protein [Tanacetum cinerariifolium]
VLDLKSVKTEFPAIVFSDSLTSNETPSCEPMVSSLNNNEIDFRVSFDESDDEDYTDLDERIRMVYIEDDRHEVFVTHAWRRLFGIRAPLIQEFILEFFSTCRIKDEMGLDVAGTMFSVRRDFLRGAPSYTNIRDPVRRLCHKLISYNISRRGHAPVKVTTTDIFYLHSMDRGIANVPYLLAQYMFRHADVTNVT